MTHQNLRQHGLVCRRQKGVAQPQQAFAAHAAGHDEEQLLFFGDSQSGPRLLPGQGGIEGRRNGNAEGMQLVSGQAPADQILRQTFVGCKITVQLRFRQEGNAGIVRHDPIGGNAALAPLFQRSHGFHAVQVGADHVRVALCLQKAVQPFGVGRVGQINGRYPARGIVERACLVQRAESPGSCRYRKKI